MPRIHFRIARTGGVTMTTEGYSGAVCHDAAAAFRARLGEVTEEENTDEYYEEPEEKQQVTY